MRLRARFNGAFRKATPGRRAMSGVALVAMGAFVVLVIWTPQFAGLLVLSRQSVDAELLLGARTAFSIGLLAYTVVLVYGTLLFTISALLLDRDLELLLVSPTPVAAVLGAKTWLRAGGLCAIAVLVLLPLLVGVPLVTAKPLAGPVGFLVVAATPLVPVAVVSAVVMSVVRFVPASRGREVVALLALGLALGLQLTSLAMNQGYASGRGGAISGMVAGLSRSGLAATPWLPSGWGARAITDALAGDQLGALGWTALLVGVGLLATWASVSVSSRVYLNGWTEYRAQRRRPGRAPRPAPVTPAARDLRPLLSRLGLDPAAVAVMTKDWRTRRRDIVMLVRMVLPMLALAFLVYRGGGGLAAFRHVPGGPLAAAIALVPVPLVTLGLATALGLTAMSMEGGAMWMYAVSPNPLSRMLLGKILVAAPPIALAAAGGAAYTEFEVHPGVAWALPAIIVAGVYGASLGMASVAVGAIFPRFNWTDPRRMISPVGAWVGLFVQLGMAVLVAIFVTVGVIAGRAGVLPAGAAYAGGLLLAAAGCIGLAVLALGAANARLEGIEYGQGLAEQSLT